MQACKYWDATLQGEFSNLNGLTAHKKVKSVVINMEHAAFDQGLAQQLANHLKAPCYALSELKAENLYHTVKEEMARPAKK